MSDTVPVALSDRNNKPDDKMIASMIGDKMKFWKEIMNYLNENHTGATGDWNFYNDGKQWLFKMMHKKKTIFWSGLVNDTFRITFYFGDKAEPQILSADLPQKLKDDFKNGKRYGKIRAMSLIINDMEDVSSVKKLTEIKVRMK